MTNIHKRNFIGATLLAFIFSMALSLQAAQPKTEEQLIGDLSSPNEKIVNSALLKLEKEYPTSTLALPTIKKLLTDPRESVRRKAGRVLGSLHAEVDSTDIKNICAQLKSPSSQEQMDGLKSLRGLRAQSAVPEILPLLKSPTPNVIRDACRTLAVLGDKSTISEIEPLLSHPDPKVQKDAMDAIASLKAK